MAAERRNIEFMSIAERNGVRNMRNKTLDEGTFWELMEGCITDGEMTAILQLMVLDEWEILVYKERISGRNGAVGHTGQVIQKVGRRKPTRSSHEWKRRASYSTLLFDRFFHTLHCWRVKAVGFAHFIASVERYLSSVAETWLDSPISENDLLIREESSMDV